MRVPSTLGGQKKVSDPLETVLQPVVSGSVDVGTKRHSAIVTSAANC